MNLVYFSPTYTSKKAALAFGREFGQIIEYDVTLEALDRTFGADELVVVSVPVYSGRIPPVVHARLAAMNGEETKCIINVTFGNRDFDDALMELYDLVSAKGFIVIGAMATIGEHTYGDIQKGRPNQGDFDQIQEYARMIKTRVQTMITVPGNHPYKELQVGGNKFVPAKNDKCIGCNWCVENCPMGAISADVTVDPEKCIACFRCVKFCPVQGIAVDSMKYHEFAKMFSERLKNRQENQFF